MNRKLFAEKLKELGSNKYQVAANLLAMKIRGERHTLNQCPIGNYCKQILPKDSSLVVSCMNIAVHGNFTIPTPNPISEFIEDFDNGRFPRLEV